LFKEREKCKRMAGRSQLIVVSTHIQTRTLSHPMPERSMSFEKIQRSSAKATPPNAFAIGSL